MKKIGRSVYHFRKYPTPPIVPYVYNNQSKLLLSYLVSIGPILSFQACPSSKPFTRPCRRWIVFHLTAPFSLQGYRCSIAFSMENVPTRYIHSSRQFRPSQLRPYTQEKKHSHFVHISLIRSKFFSNIFSRVANLWNAESMLHPQLQSNTLQLQG